MQIRSLKPGHWAKHCSTTGKGFQEVKGPLYFRATGAGVQTTVYETRDEADEISELSGTPLLTQFETRDDGNVIVHGFVFGSQREDIDEQYNLVYSLRNTGPTPITVHLGGLPPPLLNQLSDTPFRGPLTVSPEQTVQTQFTVDTSADALPFTGWLPVTITGADGTIEIRIVRILDEFGFIRPEDRANAARWIGLE